MSDGLAMQLSAELLRRKISMTPAQIISITPSAFHKLSADPESIGKLKVDYEKQFNRFEGIPILILRDQQEDILIDEVAL